MLWNERMSDGVHGVNGTQPIVILVKWVHDSFPQISIDQFLGDHKRIEYFICGKRDAFCWIQVYQVFANRTPPRLKADAISLDTDQWLNWKETGLIE